MDPSVSDGFATFGPWALIGFAVLAVFRGFMVPRPVVEDVRAELDYYRRRNRELEEQLGLARAEAARLGVTLAQYLSVAAPGPREPA